MLVAPHPMDAAKVFIFSGEKWEAQSSYKQCSTESWADSDQLSVTVLQQQQFILHCTHLPVHFDLSFTHLPVAFRETS